jgi:hypothetical protein
MPWHYLSASSEHMRFIQPWGLWLDPFYLISQPLAWVKLSQTLTGLLGNAAVRRYWRLEGFRIFSTERLAACTTLEDMQSMFKVSVIERVTGS